MKLTGNAKNELKKSTNPSSSSNKYSWKTRNKDFKEVFTCKFNRTISWFKECHDDIKRRQISLQSENRNCYASFKASSNRDGSISVWSKHVRHRSLFPQESGNMVYLHTKCTYQVVFFYFVEIFAGIGYWHLSNQIMCEIVHWQSNCERNRNSDATLIDNILFATLQPFYIKLNCRGRPWL